MFMLTNLMDLDLSPLGNPHSTWNFIESYFHSIIGLGLAEGLDLEEVGAMGAAQFTFGAVLNLMVLVTWVKC
jgi:hypothetical protein